MIDPAAVGIGIGAWLIVAFGAGRVIEDFTNETLMKWIWAGVMTFFAVCMAIGMWGFARSIEIINEQYGNKPVSTPREGDPEYMPGNTAPTQPKTNQ
ncbi:MAG: hypothetical protein L6Q71_05195 [Planctomycetes bacterium]|nr:hypothetical protein [Planctomycetota bacterium]NUQ35224.1 hypothetical protein [Planctomycetaceae bacterium]